MKCKHKDKAVKVESGRSLEQLNKDGPWVEALRTWVTSYCMDCGEMKMVTVK